MFNFIKRLCKHLWQRRKYGSRVHFPFSATIHRNAVLEPDVSIGRRSFFSGSMDSYSYISDDCDINARIGRYCSIAPGVKTVWWAHPFTYPFFSTSPVFFSLRRQCGVTFAKEQTYSEERLALPGKGIAVDIGHDVWIGQEAMLIGGVKIGHGAVVLARAVVTRDVPPYAIVGGVPARVLRYRYSEADISRLLQSEWWNCEERPPKDPLK